MVWRFDELEKVGAVSWQASDAKGLGVKTIPSTDIATPRVGSDHAGASLHWCSDSHSRNACSTRATLLAGLNGISRVMSTCCDGLLDVVAIRGTHLQRFGSRDRFGGGPHRNSGA
jgi:hypothetical protein